MLYIHTIEFMKNLTACHIVKLIRSQQHFAGSIRPLVQIRYGLMKVKYYETHSGHVQSTCGHTAESIERCSKNNSLSFENHIVFNST